MAQNPQPHRPIGSTVSSCAQRTDPRTDGRRAFPGSFCAAKRKRSKQRGTPSSKASVTSGRVRGKTTEPFWDIGVFLRKTSSNSLGWSHTGYFCSTPSTLNPGKSAVHGTGPGRSGWSRADLPYLELTHPMWTGAKGKPLRLRRATTRPSVDSSGFNESWGTRSRTGSRVVVQVAIPDTTNGTGTCTRTGAVYPKD